MKLLKIIIIIFFALTIEIKADTEKEIINNLQKGGNLIFIRFFPKRVLITPLESTPRIASISYLLMGCLYAIMDRQSIDALDKLTRPDLFIILRI